MPIVNLDNLVPFLFGVNFLFIGCHALMRHFNVDNFNPQYQMFIWCVLYWGAGLVLAAAYPYSLFGWMANGLDIIGSWFILIWSQTIDQDQNCMFMDHRIIVRPDIVYKIAIILTPIVATVVWLIVISGIYETKLLTTTNTQIVGNIAYDTFFATGTSLLCLASGIISWKRYRCMKGRILALSLIVFWASDATQPIYSVLNVPYDAATLLWFIEWALAVAGLVLFNFAYFLRYDR